MKYLVIQKYYDNGKTDAYIREVDDSVKDFGPIDFNDYDEYGNAFDNIRDAKQFKIDTLKA